MATVNIVVVVTDSRFQWVVAAVAVVVAVHTNISDATAVAVAVAVHVNVSDVAAVAFAGVAVHASAVAVGAVGAAAGVVLASWR